LVDVVVVAISKKNSGGECPLAVSGGVKRKRGGGTKTTYKSRPTIFSNTELFPLD